MVQAATLVRFKVLASEIEALLIEAELIRLHQPQYNILLKDDKSPIYLQIKPQPFAKVALIRKKDLLTQKVPSGTITLGPFSSAYKLKQVLKIARQIFPWCDEAENRIKPVTAQQLTDQKIQQQLTQFAKPCFYYHLELCPGACIGKITALEYQNNLKQLTLFLRGKKKQVLQQLKMNMLKLAQELKYEQANSIKQKIELIESVTSHKFQLKPDLILPALHDNAQENALDHLRKILLEYGLIAKQEQLSRIEGYDVSNILGKNAAVSLVTFTQGYPDKKNYRLFNIYQSNQPNDYKMLQEAIKRRQNHWEWGRPNLIIVDGGKGQVRAALSVWGQSTPIIGIAKHPDRMIIPLHHSKNKNNQRLEINYQVLHLAQDHPALRLIQQVRDEAHRFAKKQHISLRARGMVENS